MPFSNIFLIGFAMLIMPFSANNSFADTNTIKEINLEQMQTIIQDDSTIVIDNRDKALYDEGHIKNALNMTYVRPNHPGNVMTKEALTPYKEQTIIFYCSGGNRAFYAAKQAIEWGISNKIYWYKNGWPEWQSFNKQQTQ